MVTNGNAEAAKNRWGFHRRQPFLSQRFSRSSQNREQKHLTVPRSLSTCVTWVSQNRRHVTQADRDLGTVTPEKHQRRRFPSPSYPSRRGGPQNRYIPKSSRCGGGWGGGLTTCVLSARGDKAKWALYLWRAYVSQTRGALHSSPSV
jgi:hypothetical protein